MSRIEYICWSLTTVLVVAMFCGAFTYGCTTTNRQYYDAMRECIQAGGSAVPTAGQNMMVCVRK